MRVIKIFLIIFVILGGLTWLVQFGVRYWFEHKLTNIITAEDKALFQEWITQPINFPPEMLEAEPFREETLAATQAFREAWEKHGSAAEAIAYRLIRNGPPPERKVLLNVFEDPDYQPPVEALTAIDLLIAAFELLIAQSDYEMEAASLKPTVDLDFNVKIPIPNFQCFQISTNLLALKAIAQVQAGKVSEALETAERIILAGTTHPGSHVISQEIGMAIVHTGTSTWEYAIRHTDNPELLRRTLDRQNILSVGLSFFNPNVSMHAMDQIGPLRALKHEGINSQLQGKTGQEIFARQWGAKAQYLETHDLPDLDGDEIRVQLLREKIEENRQMEWFYQFPDRMNRSMQLTFFSTCFGYVLRENSLLCKKGGNPNQSRRSCRSI
jgi:hypothetical protein